MRDPQAERVAFPRPPPMALLIREGWTTPGVAGISGGSNGGPDGRRALTHGTDLTPRVV